MSLYKYSSVEVFNMSRCWVLKAFKVISMVAVFVSKKETIIRIAVCTRCCFQGHGTLRSMVHYKWVYKLIYT